MQTSNTSKPKSTTGQIVTKVRDSAKEKIINNNKEFAKILNRFFPPKKSYLVIGVQHNGAMSPLC